jgi:hypothetical protein
MTPPLPTSIWVLAWTSLVSQGLAVLDRGVRDDETVFLLVSAALGALIVGYVAAGVVRARTIRVALAWIVLVLTGLSEIVSLASGGSTPFVLVDLVLTVVSLVALARFSRSDWYRWQRARPPTSAGPSITGLVAIGIAVGVLGGLVVPAEDGVRFRINSAERF